MRLSLEQIRVMRDIAPELAFERAPELVYVLVKVDREVWWAHEKGLVNEKWQASVYDYEELCSFNFSRPRDMRWDPVGVLIPLE